MKTIEQYNLIEKISETDISEIYTAFDSKNKIPVNITLISKNSLTFSDIARIKQEYHAIKKIDNIGILKIYDVFDATNNIAIVNEEFKGGSLSNYLKNKRIDFIILYP